MRSNLVDIEALLVHETADAYLFRFDADKDPVWVPKSVCEYDRDTNTATMPQPIAEEKGMV